ncbi:M23 family metallopeptidase [Roseibium sp.]|uniref:M23 family metallopeptidase n=1 Tax=Roseibium sp. TaxID=1936156 RepID=UPI003A9812AB
MYRAQRNSTSTARTPAGTFRTEHMESLKGSVFNRTKWGIIFAGTLACTALLYAGVVGVTSMREDLVSSANQQRDQLEQSYEERIYQLRSEVDRLTSRQALTQANLDEQMSMLLRRQQSLQARHSLVSELVERAERSGLPLAITTPMPSRKPDIDQAAATGKPDHLLAIGGESEPIDDPFAALGLRGSSNALPLSETRADPVASPSLAKPEKTREEKAALNRLRSDLSAMDIESSAALEAIAMAAKSQLDDLLDTTRPLGMTMASARQLASRDDSETLAVGGPYEPILGTGFAFRAAQAESALNELDMVKSAVRSLPLTTPARGARLSSQFGPRMDPFLGTIAMHTGMDFMAPRGTSVHAAGPGVVIKAGRNGGYGNMVAIRHANGLVTRYAHLSRILVNKGERTTSGQIIGQVGSTGRSTGPHLHYEVRLNGKPIDPSTYVRAGKALSRYL